MGNRRQARKIARKVFRKNIRLPKRIVVKKLANTVGQIVRRKRGRSVRPSHGFGFKKRRTAFAGRTRVGRTKFKRTRFGRRSRY